MDKLTENIMKIKYEEICPNCYTRNDNWLHRTRMAKKEEVVHC